MIFLSTVWSQKVTKLTIRWHGKFLYYFFQGRTVTGHRSPAAVFPSYQNRQWKDVTVRWNKICQWIVTHEREEWLRRVKGLRRCPIYRHTHILLYFKKKDRKWKPFCKSVLTSFFLFIFSPFQITRNNPRRYGLVLEDHDHSVSTSKKYFFWSFTKNSWNAKNYASVFLLPYCHTIFLRQVSPVCVKRNVHASIRGIYESPCFSCGPYPSGIGKQQLKPLRVPTLTIHKFEINDENLPSAVGMKSRLRQNSENEDKRKKWLRRIYLPKIKSAIITNSCFFFLSLMIYKARPKAPKPMPNRAVLQSRLGLDFFKIDRERRPTVWRRL